MIPPIVSDAGERARACCRDDSSGGAVRLDRGALDTALHTDSVSPSWHFFGLTGPDRGMFSASKHNILGSVMA